MKSIRSNLIVTQFAGLALVLGIVGIFLFLFVRKTLIGNFDESLITKAQVVQRTLQLDDGRLKWNNESQSHMNLNPQDSQEFCFQITLTNGSTFQRSALLGTNILVIKPPLTETPVFWSLMLPNGQAGRAVGMRLRISKPPEAPKSLVRRDREEDDENEHDPLKRMMNPLDPLSGKKMPGKPARIRVAEVDLVLAGSMASVAQTLGLLRTALIFAGFLVLLGAGGVVSFALHRSLSPVNRLAQWAGSVHANSLHERFSTTQLPLELRPISKCLNDLLSRLEQSFERERRFNSNLAHELRTPVGELRAIAEVALKWGPQSHADNSRDTLEIAMQMESIIKRLLDLARCETGRIPLQSETVRLAPLVRDILLPLQNTAASKSLKLDLIVPAGAQWNTDRTLLELILTNLLGNAVEYTPEHGTISVDCEVHKGNLRFVVENTVSNLTKDELPMLFHRFWRKDASRTGSKHAGLGLALSQAFAQQLGFTLNAELKDDVTLMLILESAAPDPPPQNSATQNDSDLSAIPLSPQSLPDPAV
jgi:signal transduction histidine kinase